MQQKPVDEISLTFLELFTLEKNIKIKFKTGDHHAIFQMSTDQKYYKN